MEELDIEGGHRPSRGRGGYRGGGGRGRGDYPKRQDWDQPRTDYKKDFDFSRNKMQEPMKHHYEEREEAHPEKQDEDPKYDPSAGFFDAISNSTLNRGGEDRRFDNRKKDEETFGQVANTF